MTVPASLVVPTSVRQIAPTVLASCAGRAGPPPTWMTTDQEMARARRWFEEATGGHAGGGPP